MDFVNNNRFEIPRFVDEYIRQHFSNFKVIGIIEGHVKTIGRHAYKEKNPLWQIKNEEEDKEYVLMYCETNAFCQLCPESFQRILDFERDQNDCEKLSWYKMKNGYIMNKQNLYVHQVITGCHGNGKGTKTISVDHIDRNPLNNTLVNLRIATRKEQEQNSKGIAIDTKRERKHNAKPLPEGITQDMMKKYVTYYHEWLNADHTRFREFFKVEKHPKLPKIWIGSKSKQVPILTKLQQANQIVDNLEMDIFPIVEETHLPPFTNITMFREKPHLIYERKTEDKRYNLTRVLPENYDLQEQLELFAEKLFNKYPEMQK
jgi:hypothetical protein